MCSKAEALSGTASTTHGGFEASAPEAIIRNGSATETISVGFDTIYPFGRGFPIGPGETFRLPIDRTQIVYLITDSGTAFYNAIRFVECSF